MSNSTSHGAAPTVSVLVPVYNSAKYLTEALDSILAQTLDDLEVVCVDDGSTDESPAILDEYAAKDPRVRVFHRANAGAAAARNFALGQVRGKYACYIDSDDFIEPMLFAEAVACAEANDVDIVLFDVDMYLEDSGTYAPSGAVEAGTFKPNAPFDPCEVKGLYRKVKGYTVNKLYRSDYLLGSGITFPQVSVHEDMPFTYVLLSGAESAYFIDKVLYHYRIHGSDSVTQGSNDTYLPMLEALEAFQSDLKSKGLWQLFEQEYENYFLHMLSWKYSILHGRTLEGFIDALRDEWLKRLQVGSHDDEYYYSHKEVELLRRIEQYDYVSYLEMQNARLNNELKACKKQLGANAGVRAATRNLAGSVGRSVKRRLGRVFG